MQLMQKEIILLYRKILMKKVLQAFKNPSLTSCQKHSTIIEGNKQEANWSPQWLEWMCL